MGRWEPDARGRLEQAALELYVENGFDNTTVAEIAERAGLTERTFFRHFADKREVLFSGSGVLIEVLSNTTLDAPATATPIEAVATALEAVAEVLQPRWAVSRRRQSVINANPELQEREHTKLASWATALADALRQRGVDDLNATLTAETALVAFRVGFARWIQQSKKRDLSEVFRQTLEQLGTIASDT